MSFFVAFTLQLQTYNNFIDMQVNRPIEQKNTKTSDISIQ